MAKQRYRPRKMSARQRYEASQRQHERLRWQTRDAVKAAYHQEVHELQSIDKKILSKTKRRSIWDSIVQRQKSWVPPTVTSVPGFGDVFFGGSDGW